MQNLILGIETSCDDTCLALLSLNCKIIYEKSSSQIDIHKQYGGVVPELASRDHLQKLQLLYEDLRQNIDTSKICCVSVTSGPGLIGSLLVGMMFAKGLAISLNVPLICINHLEGHIMSSLIEEEGEHPFITCLVSGGHSQLILVEEFGKYILLGSTVDDAAGEAFDKIAKMLGLPYPGGPLIEKLASKSFNNNEFTFKPCLIDNKTLNFSFSGLKTQVLYKIKELGNISEEMQSNIAYAAQEAIINTLIIKSQMAILHAKKIIMEDKKSALSRFVLCGGVSANSVLRSRFDLMCQQNNLKLILPKMQYSTDNAVMIARAALERYKQRLFSNLNAQPKARWPMNEI